MDKRLLDKEWRMSHLYKIVDKDTGALVPFKRNRMQEHFERNKHTFNIVLKSRQLGFCVDPKTRILTADLRWVRVDSLKPGTEIVAVDEFNDNHQGRSRRMKTAIVEKVVFLEAPAYEITFDDGRSVICTAKHPWLSKKTATDTIWRAIEPTIHGRGVLTVGTKVRWITKPWEDQSVEDGWFGGILDGEGSISKPNHSSGINASQRDGDVWDRMVKYGDDNGFHYRVETDYRSSGSGSKLGSSPVNKICFGRIDEIFKLVGKTRPSRFIGNRFWEGKELPGKKTGIGWSKIISIKPIGNQLVVDLQTSAKTYIAEGFVSHNTTYESVDMLDDAMFSKNFSGLFIAHTKDGAETIFDKKVKFSWLNIPEPIRNLYELVKDSSNELKLGFGDGSFSSIIVANSGRSGTYSRIHSSEFAKLCKLFPERAYEIITGTIPSVPTGARFDIEGTAEGEIGYFYEMFWEAWLRGEPKFPKQFKAHFYNWQWDDVEIAKVTPEETQTFLSSGDYAEFQAYRESMKARGVEITDRELTYLFKQWLSLSKNWKLLHQEFPTTPEEAFISSGNKLFDQDVIAGLKFMNPVREEGDWKIFEEYIPSGFYAMGADVAEGVGQDSSTAVILRLDVMPIRVVATFKNKKIAPDQFALELAKYGSRYGRCIIAPEVNSIGNTTVTKLKEVYPNVYRDLDPRLNLQQKTRYTNNVKTLRYGWRTTATSKPFMMYAISDAINNGDIEVNDGVLIHEMRTYDREDLSQVRFDDKQTQHWDLLIALAIAYQMRTKVSRGRTRAFAIPN